MHYADVFIPLVVGLLFAFAPDALLKPDAQDYYKKRKRLKIAGFVLVGVAVLYFVVKVVEMK